MTMITAEQMGIAYGNHLFRPVWRKKPCGYGIEPTECPAWKEATQACGGDDGPHYDGVHDHWLANTKQSHMRWKKSNAVWRRCCKLAASHAIACEWYRRWVELSLTQKYPDERCK